MCKEKPSDNKVNSIELLQNNDYNILYIPLPDDKNSENYKKLAEQKRSIINKMIEAGHYNFDYAILPDLVIRNKEIRGPIYINNAKIYGNVIFYNTVVNDAVYLRNAYIEGNVELIEFEIEGILSMKETEIKENLVIQDSLIDGDLELSKAKIGGSLVIKYTEVNNFAHLDISCVNSIDIGYSTFRSLISLGIENDSKIIVGDYCSFYNALYYVSNLYKNRGYIDTSEKYFYEAMRARRECLKSKGIVSKIIAYVEKLFVDLTCKYGLSWKRPILLWFIVVTLFALIYWFSAGIVDVNGMIISHPPNIEGLAKSIYFSLITITTLGYGDFRPANNLYGILAGIEASIGLFIWALFIAVFSRKYLR